MPEKEEKKSPIKIKPRKSTFLKNLKEDDEFRVIVDQCDSTLQRCGNCEFYGVCDYLANHTIGSPYQYKENEYMKKKKIGELVKNS